MACNYLQKITETLGLRPEQLIDADPELATVGLRQSIGVLSQDEIERIIAGLRLQNPAAEGFIRSCLVEVRKIPTH